MAAPLGAPWTEPAAGRTSWLGSSCFSSTVIALGEEGAGRQTINALSRSSVQDPPPPQG